MSEGVFLFDAVSQWISERMRSISSSSALALALAALLLLLPGLSTPAAAGEAVDAEGAGVRGAAGDNICARNVTLGKQILQALNLSYPGLERAAAAAAAGQYGDACELVAAYYVGAPSGAWLRVPPVKPGTGRAGGQADAALEDIFTLSGVGETAKVPRNPDGGLDWLDEGPRHDIEFMNCLNRHEVFDVLLTAWQATGNPIYAAKFCDLLTDWVLHLPCNPCTTGTMESPWRILEVGIRTVDPWPRAFYGFQNSSAFNTTGRVLLLLGLHEHGVALMKYGSEGAPNWRMQQWAGLGTIALAFPELADSSVWLAQALKGMQDEVAGEVYPDGVETEQTSGYDVMSANNFYRILWTLAQAGREAPETYAKAVENMFTYIAFAIDQAGYLPRNGDADLMRPWSTSMQAIMRYFNRTDWEYVYTQGQFGTKPSTGPSVMFPWAGQFVMKSGYTTSDHWAFFDVGVYGSSGHAHRDKLHLNIRGYGSLLLVDSGRFAYAGTGSIFHAQYAPSTRAHNTLTIDGCQQSAAPPTATKAVDPATWSIGEVADYARGSMDLWDNLKGNATHHRAVYYRKGQWFVAVDMVVSDRPRSVQATWHAHPNSTVTLGSGAVGTVLGVPRGQIAVIPTLNQDWTAQIVRGMQPPKDPYFQGWFSASYLDCEPAPVLVYDAKVASTAVFAWLLLPTPEPAPVNASIAIVASNQTAVTFKVSIAGQPDVVETVVVA